MFSVCKRSVRFVSCVSSLVWYKDEQATHHMNAGPTVLFINASLSVTFMQQEIWESDREGITHNSSTNQTQKITQSLCKCVGQCSNTAVCMGLVSHLCVT